MKIERLLSFVVILSLFSSCEKDPVSTLPGLEDIVPNKITLQFVSVSDTSQTFRFTWRDSDGDGGAAPTSDTITLDTGTYHGSLTATYDLNGKNVDVTQEYVKYAVEHLVEYKSLGSSASRLVISTTDKDVNGLPLGLKFNAVVGKKNSSSNNRLQVRIGHFATTSKPSTGQLPDGAEHDVSVEFVVES